MSRFQVWQELLQKWTVGIGRNRADEALRPCERLGRIGRHRGQPGRPSRSGAVEVDRQRFPDRLDSLCEVRMLPEQHFEPGQRQIRRHAECGIPAAEDRYPLSGQVHPPQIRLARGGNDQEPSLNSIRREYQGWLLRKKQDAAGDETPSLDLERLPIQPRLTANRNWLREDVQDRAMGIDRLYQTSNVLRRRRTGDIDSKGHVLEASRDVRNAEEPAQIHPALSGHIDAVERDPKHPRIRRVDDFLTRAQRGEDQFDWGGSDVGPPNQRRLIHVEREFTNVHLRAVLVDERGSRRKGHNGRLWRITKVRPHLFDDRSEPIDLLLRYHGRISFSDAGGMVVSTTPPLTGGGILELSIQKYNTRFEMMRDGFRLRRLE